MPPAISIAGRVKFLRFCNPPFPCICPARSGLSSRPPLCSFPLSLSDPKTLNPRTYFEYLSSLFFFHPLLALHAFFTPLRISNVSRLGRFCFLTLIFPPGAVNNTKFPKVPSLLLLGSSGRLNATLWSRLLRHPQWASASQPRSGV